MGAVLYNEGLVLMIIGIIGIIDGLRLNRISSAANEAFGPAWYLIIISIIMIMGGFSCFVSSIKNINKKKEVFRFSLGPASLAIVAMVIYSVVVSYLGYFVSNVAFLLVGMRLFGEQSWVRAILIAGVSGVAFWFLFVFFAKIPVP